MHFINSRLIPVSHDTRINWERAVLAFCIVTRKKFDVGRIINKQLIANMGRKSPFYFPCLVTEMCRRARLKPKNPEAVEIIPVGSSIDQGTLKIVRENEGVEEGEENKKEVGSEGEEEEEDGGEKRTETVEGASEIKLEEQQETPKAKPKPQPRKITFGKRKEGGSASNAGAMTLWARGADMVAMQIQNIERMLAQEIRDVKTASLMIATEKAHLEHESEQLKNQEPVTNKRKFEPSEGKE